MKLKLILLFLLFIVLSFMPSCLKNKWNLMVLPKLSAVQVTSNNQTFSELSCEVLIGEKQRETIFGFCFSSNPMPTIADSVIEISPNGNQLNLKFNWDNTEHYYVRAFCKNKLGVSYSEDQIKLIWPANTNNIPQVSLTAIDSVSYFFADGQAVITNDGNLQIIQRGFIFSTNSNPTMFNSIICNSSSNNFNFTNRNEGLAENTVYYVRAFVKNTYQTALSTEILSIQTKNFFNIGEQGPGGGRVFYTNLSGTSNWHFLEAAPSDFSTQLNWSNNTNSINGTNTSIGSGLLNTMNITSNQGNSGNYAAIKAEQFVLSGLSDWFLPSRQELTELIEADNTLGGFNLNLASEYWSSSQDSNFTQNSWIVICESPVSSYTLSKLTTQKARFIRRF